MTMLISLLPEVTVKLASYQAQPTYDLRSPVSQAYWVDPPPLVDLGQENERTSELNRYKLPQF